MNLRYAIAVPIFLLASMASAQWTYKSLHPAGSLYSEGTAADGNKQVGNAMNAQALARAAIWTGTNTFLDVTPTGAKDTYIEGAGGGKQVGGAQFEFFLNACLWSGTKASYVDLHPAVASRSNALGTDGVKQVGVATINSVNVAGLWSGTKASFVNLNPTGATGSWGVKVLGNKQVGSARFDGADQAGIWTNTAASFVSLHPAGASISQANALTETQQGGVATFNEVQHAILWSGTAASAVDLHPAGAGYSMVHDMMGSTQVGLFKTGDVTHACYWTGTAASMVDLHSALPAHYQYSAAKGISTDGVKVYIVGYAYNLTTEDVEAIMWSRPVEVGFNFTLNKTTVAGQNSVQGTITLDSAVPTATVFTTYDNSALVTTPATVTVAANTTVKNFQITVTAVTSPINTTVYAKLGTVVKSKPLTLAPLIPTALSFTPNPVTGGQTTACKVVINGVAGPGGRVIAILDNSPNATVPSTVTVPAGGTSVTFNITTTTVTSVKNVTVTARVSAGEKTGTFRINP